MEHQKTMSSVIPQKLPLGVTDFSQIRTENYYYVDKTQFIEDVCDHRYRASLIARPSGFGKTLCLDMLRCFFEMDSDKSLFAGLHISKNTELCEKYMGKYPVIAISFKNVDAKNYEKAREQPEKTVIEEAQRFLFLKDGDKLNADQKDWYLSVLEPKKNTVALEESLANLAMVLQWYYKRCAILMVDDWDTPMLAAARYGYYDQMALTLRRMVEIAVGANDCVEFSVLMGCLHIPFGGGYFDPYNYKYDSILRGQALNAGGFDESDIKEITEYYGLSDSMEEVNRYCGGYQIITTKLFSPSLVLDFIAEAIEDQPALKLKQATEAKEYRKLDAILSCEDYFDAVVQRSMKKLLNGESIQTEIKPYVKYKDDNMVLSNPLWSILLLHGYFTVDCREKYAGFDFYIIRVSNDKSREKLQDWLIVWKSKNRGDDPK